MAMKIPKKDAGRVYSTESGKLCPDCNKPADQCRCRKKPLPSQTDQRDGIVRLMRQTKGRNGKGVTLISGLPLDGEELKNLAKLLKQKCGCGGSVKDGIVEIQGDQREILEQELVSLGYKVKRAGG
jgi:translation initiation factor 1